jgi:hypothetical protein
MVLLVAQAVIEASLSERLLVAVAGPLVSTIVGTGVIGWILFRVASNAQAHRAEGELRRELLAAVTQAAGGLYLATQRFWRARKDADLSDEAKLLARKDLDAQYHDSRTASGSFEPMLEVLFGHALAIEWHKIDDLLTVRYMQVTSQDTSGIYRANSTGHDGRAHSGLTTAQLQDPKVLLAAYRKALANVTYGLLNDSPNMDRPPEDLT